MRLRLRIARWLVPDRAVHIRVHISGEEIAKELRRLDRDWRRKQ